MRDGAGATEPSGRSQQLREGIKRGVGPLPFGEGLFSFFREADRCAIDHPLPSRAQDIAFRKHVPLCGQERCPQTSRRRNDVEPVMDPTARLLYVSYDVTSTMTAKGINYGGDIGKKFAQDLGMKLGGFQSLL